MYLPEPDLTFLLSSHRDEQPEDEAGSSLLPMISSPGAILRAILAFLVQEAQKAGLAPSIRMLLAISVPREFGVAPQQFSTAVVTIHLPSASGLVPKALFSPLELGKSHFPPWMEVIGLVLLHSQDAAPRPMLFPLSLWHLSLPPLEKN